MKDYKAEKMQKLETKELNEEVNVEAIPLDGVTVVELNF